MQIEAGLPDTCRHLFTAHWQDGQCRRLAANLPLGHVYINADFSENYTFTKKFEVRGDGRAMLKNKPTRRAECSLPAVRTLMRCPCCPFIARAGAIRVL